MWREKSSILHPDPRFRFMARGIDPASGPRFVTIEDMYGDVEAYTLGECVPEGVRRQFDIARTAYVYPWFEYDLMTLAEMRAFATFELAIRYRARVEKSGMKSKKSLKRAVDHAGKMGWLRDEDFWIHRGRCEAISGARRDGYAA